MTEQEQYPTREQVAEALRGVYDEAAEVEDPARRVPFDIDYTAADAVLALFPQPTPSAEQCVRCGGTGYQGDGPNALGVPCPDCAVAPPSIAGMAPGTTFTAQYQAGAFHGEAGRWRKLNESVVVLASSGTPALVTQIDPSTIRYVTPPKDAA